MSGPFDESSIVIEAETNDPTEYVQFEPNGLPGEFWLHPREKFDATIDLDEIVEEYALPESDSYVVRLIELPAGVSIRLGPAAAKHGREGGGEIVDPIEYDTIPESWIRETKTLER